MRLHIDGLRLGMTAEINHQRRLRRRATLLFA
jgi:hypothetical protein